MGKSYSGKVLILTGILTVMMVQACHKPAVPVTPSKPDTPDPEPVVTEKYVAEIFPEQSFGRRTKYYFYDLKGRPSGLVNPSTAQYLFKEIGMNGVRIPIYGDQENGGHTGPGNVGADTYRNVLASIRNALNYVRREDFVIFAGKKLNGTTTFPSWVMGPDRVDVAQYSSMLMDYLRYMKTEGIEIDVLGVDNETNFNEGKIDAELYSRIVGAVREGCEKEGIKTPLFIGPELFVPPAAFANGWLYKCYEAGLQGDIDIYGTHYYPQHHTPTFRASLQHEFELVNSDRPREFWATEPHWDNNEAAQADMLAHAEYAMCALFDQTDLGMDMFCWWAFQYEGSLRAVLMDHLSKGIFKSTPVRMTDHDGEDTMTMGRLQTRAFLREDGRLTVFVIHMGKESYPEYNIVLHGRNGFGEPHVTQWRDDTPINGTVLKAGWTQDTLRVSFPSRSITEIRIDPAQS